ncbi:MAG: hypothetical protein Q8R83_08615 [Legionellaceae bacterium]|nr:hypothetical protein [Legionellaceae bacterium]
MKITAWLHYALYQVKFFLTALFYPNYLTTRTKKHISNLRKNNKTFRELRNSKIFRLLSFFTDKSFFIIFIGILGALICITQALVLLGVLHPIIKSDLLSDLITIQGALVFALVAFFPIAALLQGASFKDSSIKDEIMQVIMRETRVFELIISSITLLCYLLFLRYINEIKLFQAFQFNDGLATLLLLWFLINVFGVYYLIKRGFDLLRPLIRNDALVRYIANHSYPIELASLLRRNIYFMLGDYYEKHKNEYTSQVYTSLSINDFAKIEVEIDLKNNAVLYDIDMRKLEYVISQWKERNHTHANSGLSHASSASLVFTVTPGEKYKNKTILCQINNGANLTQMERLLIKSAFKFRKLKSDEEEEFARAERCMRILEESTLDAITVNNLENFRAGLQQQIYFHIILVKLGEFEEDGQYYNYATIASAKFLTNLSQDWSRSYQDVYQRATSVLSENKQFFKDCCYVGYKLISQLLDNPSFSGITPIIVTQAHLWFRLNEWWETSTNKNVYDDALRTFVSGWESIQYELVGKIKKVKSWEEFTLIFNELRAHFEYTLAFATQSVLTGNKDSAFLWIESLISWNNNNSRSLNSTYTKIFWESEQVYLSEELLNKSWPEVQILITNISKFSIANITEQLVFMEILENYWKDACLAFSSLLLKWIEIPTSHSLLCFDVLKEMLNTHVDGRKGFITSIDDYIISFLRRYSGDGNYVSGLDALSRRLEELSKPPKIPGRIYSSQSTFNENAQHDLMLGALIVTINKDNKYSLFTSFEKILLDSRISNNLIGGLEQALNVLDKITLEKYESILKQISDVTEHGTAVTEINSQKNQIVLNPRPVNGFDILKDVFFVLKEKIINWRIKRIQELPISEAKLKKIAEGATTVAFTKDTGHFPVYLFQEVKWVNEPLNEYKFGYTDYSKAPLTEPTMDEGGCTIDWHRQYVERKVCPYVIFNILEKANALKIINELIVKNESEYVVAINQHSQQMITQGLHPVLIVEQFCTPEWLLQWKHTHRSSPEILRNDLRFEYKDEEKDINYLFHINNVPVYTGNALIGGSLLLSRESLKLLQFRQMDNGYPLVVTFESNQEDLTKGSLLYNIEVSAVLEKHPIYKIIYPKNEVVGSH